jgi:hypothetical protein
MAEIPSDIASSAAQAPVQSREVVKDQAARRAGMAHAAARHIKTVDESGVVVETTDSDTQIFTDAEGTGSLGRDLSDQEEESEDDTPEDRRGFVEDAAGQLHLDLEA